MADFSNTLPFGVAVSRLEPVPETEAAEEPPREVETEVVSERALARRPYETTVFVDRIELPHPLDDRLVMLWDPSSPTARNYRLLRHRLLTSGNPRVMSVTSATPGEGKTTCALNLALAIAEDELGSVLLLDANAPRPALAKVFGLDTLDRSVAFGAHAGYFSVVEVDGTRLHVASAVSGDSEARLDRAAFGELLHDLRRSYDYIVVDSAAVLESADADVAAEFSDGVIMAARAKKSRRAMVGRALDELRPATICGIVLLDT